jgi:membrane protein implicated in regulation of membrane protease activity
MTALYIICAAVGVVLALLAAFGVDHDHDAELHVDADHGQDWHGWIPFFSLRFWTYLLGAFGVTGLLLERFSSAPKGSVLGFAIGTGVACGFAITLLVRLMRGAESNTNTGEKDMLGLEGQVLVAIRPGHLGKVRCRVKGDLLDLIAVSDDGTTIEAGQTAIVVSIEANQARVIPREALFDSSVTVGS